MDTYVVRIQWGYFMNYPSYAFQHHEYRWDGGARVHGGTITRCWQLDFSGSYGDIREDLVLLPRPAWHWENHYSQNRMGGALLEIQGDMASRVEVTTRTVSLSFSLAELRQERLIRVHVGPKYSNVDITACFDGYDQNLDKPEDLQELTAVDGHWRRLVEGGDFRGAVQRWFRIDWAWAFPGKSVEVDVPQPDRWRQGEGQSMLAAVVRWSAAASKPEESFDELIQRGLARHPARAGNVDDLPYVIELNGREITRGTQKFRDHVVPQFEELEVLLDVALLAQPGNVLRITNCDPFNHLIIGRILFEERVQHELEMSVCPAWVLIGQVFEIELLCRVPQAGVEVHLPPGIVLLDEIPESMSAGRHRLRLTADEPLANAVLSFASSTGKCDGRIDQVVSCVPEDRPLLVGFEDGTFPEDIVGYREGMVRHFADNQIGNTLVSRGWYSLDRGLAVVEVCRRYGLRFQIASQTRPEWARAFRQQLGALFDGYYWSEYDGFLFGYAVLPNHLPMHIIPENRRTMRTATEAFLAYTRRLLSWVWAADKTMPQHALLSSLSHVYACEAGMTSTLVQFNKSNNVLLVANARGAARAYRKPFWGTYQAEGAHGSPEGPQHLRMWRLALLLAYTSGASQVLDEEALYGTHHQRAYARGDRVPRLRQKILKAFYRYVNSHPRRGRLITRQACLLGRYSCDSSDGLSRHDPSGDTAMPMIWRNFGGWGPEWRPQTPEYGLRYLDVFMPGAWLPNLEQEPEAVRRWYAGTPFGEIELPPIDAPRDVLAQYGLSLVLGWNTMDATQYENLKSYVEEGGRLFMSVAHTTRNESRDFLLQGMEPLNLLRDGDLQDLFGVVVKGRGARLGHIKGDPAIPSNPVGDFYQLPTVLYAPPVSPQHPPVDLASVELKGAEVLATDAASGSPVLVRYRLGKGEAYLLCTYEYPGNSRLVPFMRRLIRALAVSTPWPVELEDISGDVYYTVRKDDDSGALIVHLLNTDWTAEKNQKPCRLRIEETWFDLVVTEGRLTVVHHVAGVAIVVEDEGVHVDSLRAVDGDIRAVVHGSGPGTVRLFAPGNHIGSVTFDGVKVTLGTQGDWSIAEIAFERRSSGELVIHGPGR